MAVRGVEESRGNTVVRDAPKDAWGCAFCAHALALPREHDVNVPSCLTAFPPAAAHAVTTASNGAKPTAHLIVLRLFPRAR
jgi:hypothetical protein